MNNKEIEKISQVYQKTMGNKTPVYITGSVALRKALGSDRKDKWNYSDIDMLIPNTTKKTLPSRIARAKRACQMLDGKFTLIQFLSNDKNSPGMTDVLAKGKCKVANGKSKTHGKGKFKSKDISIAFTNSTLKHHLDTSKAPANVAYPVNLSHKFITTSNRAFKTLRTGKILLPTSGNYDLSTLIKYSPRGFFYSTDELQESKYPSYKNKDDVIKHVLEQQWRAMVTGKIHYECGAAWRNLHLAQGAIIATTGFAVAIWPKSPVHLVPRGMRAGIFIGAILAGGYIAESPSKRAIEHQVAGAKYSSLEREWVLLLNRVKNGRMSLGVADAHCIYLQQKKSQLDIESPNASKWWHKRIVTKMLSKKYSPDP